MNAAVDHYLAAFKVAEARLPGRQFAWLNRTRRGALRQFASLGFPTPRNEDWKYTRVTPIEKRAFKPEVTGGTMPGRAEIEEFLLQHDSCHLLVFIDGRFAKALSSPGALPDGVRVMSIARALTECTELVEPHLCRYANAAANGFAALNTAFMGDGAFIHLARRAIVADPIHLLFLSTQLDAEAAVHPRILVVAEAGSRATIVERYASLGEPRYLNNVLTEIALSEGACVHHYKLQEESLSAFHVATLQVRQERDSRFHSHAISFGARLARNDINIVLNAEGAQCTLNGLFMAGGRQHVDFHTRVDHLEPNGRSEEYYKGILSGRARGVFNGRVHVHPGAQKTEALQSNHNLLLSRDAEIDTKPQLEIYANDVQCAHGATIGQLDENSLFYLRSRGIAEETARGLLTYGFARDVVDRIEIAPLRERIAAGVLAHMPNARHIEALVT